MAHITQERHFRFYNFIVEETIEIHNVEGISSYEQSIDLSGMAASNRMPVSPRLEGNKLKVQA